MSKVDDERWMRHALKLAEQARDQGEVPVGAVIVLNDQLIGEGFNTPIAKHDASAHAEIQAIRMACSFTENYRLPSSTMYVTLEPCTMCAGAMVHARIERVIIAAKEPRAGAAGSALNVLQNEHFNHQCHTEFGLYSNVSSTLLKAFFKARR